MSRTRTVISTGALAVLMACSGGGSKHPTPEVTSVAPSVTPGTPAVTALEGEWDAVVTVPGMERAGFTATQIRADQKHEGWSSRYDLGLSVTGDQWVLTEAPDGETPVVAAFGPISVSEDRVRITDATPPAPKCSVVLTYRVKEGELTMDFVRSDCDEHPIEPIPDFMYAAVFVQPFSRVG